MNAYTRSGTGCIIVVPIWQQLVGIQRGPSCNVSLNNTDLLPFTPNSGDPCERSGGSGPPAPPPYKIGYKVTVAGYTIAVFTA